MKKRSRPAIALGQATLGGSHRKCGEGKATRGPLSNLTDSAPSHLLDFLASLQRSLHSCRFLCVRETRRQKKTQRRNKVSLIPYRKTPGDSSHTRLVYSPRSPDENHLRKNDFPFLLTGRPSVYTFKRNNTRMSDSCVTSLCILFCLCVDAASPLIEISRIFTPSHENKNWSQMWFSKKIQQSNFREIYFSEKYQNFMMTFRFHFFFYLITKLSLLHFLLKKIEYKT